MLGVINDILDNVSELTNEDDDFFSVASTTPLVAILMLVKSTTQLTLSTYLLYLEMSHLA